MEEILETLTKLIATYMLLLCEIKRVGVCQLGILQNLNPAPHCKYQYREFSPVPFQYTIGWVAKCKDVTILPIGILQYLTSKLAIGQKHKYNFCQDLEYTENRIGILLGCVS